MIGAWCACGHHIVHHGSDITGSGNSPCWISLDGETDDLDYPINRCPCSEYNPVEEGMHG